MNRRDFLKITAAFTTAAAVPILPAIAADPIAPPVAEPRGLRYSTEVRNAMLDALISRAAFLAVYDTSGEMIGIAPIGQIRPASEGAVNLLSISVEARKSCAIGAVKILDAAERTLLPVEVQWPTGPIVTVGESISVGRLALS